MRFPIIAVIASALAAGAATWFWVLPLFGFASYLSPPNATDIEIINQYWPHRIIQPEWFSATPGRLERLMKWHAAEGFARLSVVGVLWFTVASGSVWKYLRRIKRPNKLPEPMPGSVTPPAGAGDAPPPDMARR